MHTRGRKKAAKRKRAPAIGKKKATYRRDVKSRGGTMLMKPQTPAGPRPGSGEGQK